MENKTVLLTTQSCTKCPTVKNMIESKGLDIDYVDIEETPDLAIENSVMSVPTIITYEDGKAVTHVGQGACMELVSQL